MRSHCPIVSSIHCRTRSIKSLVYPHPQSSFSDDFGYEISFSLLFIFISIKSCLSCNRAFSLSPLMSTLSPSHPNPTHDLSSLPSEFLSISIRSPSLQGSLPLDNIPCQTTLLLLKQRVLQELGITKDDGIGVDNLRVIFAGKLVSDEEQLSDIVSKVINFNLLFSNIVVGIFDRRFSPEEVNFKSSAFSSSDRLPFTHIIIQKTQQDTTERHTFHLVFKSPLPSRLTNFQQTLTGASEPAVQPESTSPQSSIENESTGIRYRGKQKEPESGPLPLSEQETTQSEVSTPAVPYTPYVMYK
ncbi:hypothetical protein BKA69DRAFT_508278 [Paraphysoderma sedebokerense]|nr:hypothetical protein BKA69DRAFT_508278 [Paraphysoderma sedebokerense]